MTALALALREYEGLAASLARDAGLERAALERATFPDGERYFRIGTDLHARDVVLVGGTISDAATLEIFDLANGIVDGGARTLTLVVPWFGYATMERAVAGGEVVTAKTRARLLSAIPAAPLGNRILLLDLHSEGIPHYFEGSLRPTHVYAKEVILRAARELGGESFILASTDAGRAKWVESLANDLGVPAAVVLKRRLGPGTTEVAAMNADVAGAKVVIYDDMIRTGESLIRAAEAYRRAGASDIAALATHGVFPGDAFRRLTGSGLFSAIATTDSHPRAVELRGEGLILLPAAPSFVPHLRFPGR